MARSAEAASGAWTSSMDLGNLRGNQWFFKGKPWETGGFPKHIGFLSKESDEV
jgi:hypothetical protein